VATHGWTKLGRSASTGGRHESPEQHPSEIDNIQASAQEEAIQAHPEHAAAANAAFDAIHQLINEQPEFADFLRLSTSTKTCVKLYTITGLRSPMKPCGGIAAPCSRMANRPGAGNPSAPGNQQTHT